MQPARLGSPPIVFVPSDDRDIKLCLLRKTLSPSVLFNKIQFSVCSSHLSYFNWQHNSGLNPPTRFYYSNRLPKGVCVVIQYCHATSQYCTATIFSPPLFFGCVFFLHVMSKQICPLLNTHKCTHKLSWEIPGLLHSSRSQWRTIKLIKLNHTPHFNHLLLLTLLRPYL